MMISGITGISGMGNYRISSIHGNPYTLNPVSRIDDDTTQSGKALVIAAPQQKDDLYVKDYGNLESYQGMFGGVADHCTDCIQ